MSDLSAFAAALFDPERHAPGNIGARSGAHAASRFAIYRNNVVTGLIDALRETFPAVERLVGPDFFIGMARLYAMATPPTTPVLRGFARAFPDFIAAFEAARDLDYLADVARIELARIDAWHAADREPSPPRAWEDALAAPRAQVRLHPSATLLRSSSPAVAIWRMNVAGIEPAPIQEWEPEDGLIWRDADDTIHVDILRRGEGDFVEMLTRGCALDEAAAQTFDAHADFDLAAAFVLLMRTGAQPIPTPEGATS